jgi:CopG family nickel-responsive transcriptional regulator
MEMQRLTISIDDGLAAEFDTLTAEQGYTSRSEAMRDLVRHAVEAQRLTGTDAGFCVANLSYVYDHGIRGLPKRLNDIQHTHHHLVVSTMHSHLDHVSCLETSILKGPVKAVRALADAIKIERGVRFAELNLISVNPNDSHVDAHAAHDHGSNGHFSPHRG